MSGCPSLASNNNLFAHFSVFSIQLYSTVSSLITDLDLIDDGFDFSSTDFICDVDSAALRSCPNCCRRMSSLKHDSHTICSQCRAVSCSVETRCSEFKDWSVDAMQDHLKYQRSLARKSSNRKPAVTAASGSQPAVTSSLVGPSTHSAPAVSGSSQLKDAVLAVLQSLQGCLGINIDSSTAPSTVPDSAPSVGGATGGVHGMKLHNVDSRLEFPGVGALELPAQTSAISMSPVVLSDNITMLQSSARTYLGMGLVTAADRTAPLGPSPSPLGSSGADQLQAHVGPLSSSSSALSPTSLSSYSLSLLSSFFVFFSSSSSSGVVSFFLFFCCLLSSCFGIVLFLLSHSFSLSCFQSFFLSISLLPFLFLHIPFPSSFRILALPSIFFFFLFVSSSFVFLFLFPFVFSSFCFRLCLFSPLCPFSSWIPCFLFLFPGCSFFLLFIYSSPSSSFVVCFCFLLSLSSSSPS